MPKKTRYSFIDYGLHDFLRDENGEVIEVRCSNHDEAEEWLLLNGEKYGWTNTGVGYYSWDE